MSCLLPIYARPETGIYYFHTSLGGKQIKKSLRTKDKQTAIIKALPLFLEVVKQRHKMTIQKFDLNLQQGIVRTNGTEEDNTALLKALELMARVQPTHTSQTVPTAPAMPSQTGLTVRQALDKFLLVKRLKTATRLSYKNTIEEFAVFTKNTLIANVLVSDVVAFIEHLLADKKNTHRTVHGKVGTLKTFFNVCIEKGYYFQKNPAVGQEVLTKKQLATATYSIFTDQEIIQLFTSEQFKIRTEKDKDFYYACLITLITGLRAGEVTALKKRNLQVQDGINYIKIFDSKTDAGLRDVPLPTCQLVQDFLTYCQNSKQPNGKIFRYREKEGKGAGNALGKKFARLLLETKTHRDKLVFHSLRKYFNDFMKRHAIPWEMRTQLVGHETDDINNSVYSNDYTILQLNEAIEPLQQKILLLIV